MACETGIIFPFHLLNITAQKQQNPFLATHGIRAFLRFQTSSAYQTVPVAKNSMTALGIQFNEVGSQDKEIPVKSLLSVDVPKPGTGANNLTDQIHVWTGAAWKKYYNQRNVGWVCVDQADKTVETEDTVKVGDGVFFRRPGSATANITLSGEVCVNDATMGVDVAKNSMTFFAYPWPTSIAISNFYNYVSVPKSGTGANNLTDQVHVWGGAAWKKYFHSRSLGGYASADDTTKLTEDKIESATCFFFRRPGSATATITFPRPEGL